MVAYKGLYSLKLTTVKDQEDRIGLGLRKLEDGAEDVEKMKLVLAKEEVKLQAAQRACSEMLSNLEVSSLQAKKEQEPVLFPTHMTRPHHA